MKKILLLSFLFLFIFSQNINATPVDIIKPKTPTEKSIHSKKKKKRKKFFARITEKFMKKRAKKILKKFKLAPIECVRITTTDGEEIEALIVSEGEERIRYKKCDFVNGPIRTIRKEDIFMIKYADGKKEMVAEQVALKQKKENGNQEEKKDYKSYWGLGFFLGIFLNIFALLIVAIIFSGEKRKQALRGTLAGILTIILLFLLLGALLYSII